MTPSRGWRMCAENATVAAARYAKLKGDGKMRL
jgi:hypothetical protein